MTVQMYQDPDGSQVVLQGESEEAYLKSDMWVEIGQ